MISRSFQSNRRGDRGAALLAALCFTVVLGVAIASYQTLAYYSVKTGARAVQGTRSLELAEVGLEEATYALNNKSLSSWSWASNGWTTVAVSGHNLAQKTLNFSYDTGTTGSVAITITDYDLAKPTLAAAATITDAAGNSVTRTLEASTGISTTSTTGRAPLFPNALAAVGNGTNGTGQVAFYYNGITVDSFDFSAGTDFVAGTSASYFKATVAASAGYSSTGDLVNSSTTGPVGNIALGTATVQGYAATTPTSAGAVALTSSSGAKLIGTSTATGIDASRQSTSPYQPTFTVTTPSGSGNWTNGGSISAPTSTTRVGTAGDTLPTLYYGTLDGNGNFDIENNGVLEVDGPVILVIPGNFYIGAYNDRGSIRINSGGSLEVYVSGYTYIAGSGINNTTKKPKNLAIFNTASSSSGYYSLIYTNTAFHGVVYAPNTDVYLYGRAATSSFSGSFVGRNMYVYNFTSSMKVHYDTSLRDLTIGTTVTTPYAVSSVTEQ